MRNILFVCTGNTCRSPMAEAVLRHKANSEYEVKSAGVFAHVGSPASQNSVEVLTKQSIPINHKSAQLDDELIEWSDLILTMTNAHKKLILERYPKAADKVYSLLEFALNSPADIFDPFGGTIEDYREVYEQIDEAIKQLLVKLKTHQ
ncbi:low molecular weight protein arginine phosphatase [Calidifontibacillus oryziterrae]|uniref:low molecular weight protein arginine phosphatase n=1 Tax=Calidifontibacillus oryziterrae TaxID=1191699 RepID=UPI000303CD3F|nr:low molecular weight protein arginine phosphatase [Calidifontibacillus oryziterrae]